MVAKPAKKGGNNIHTVTKHTSVFTVVTVMNTPTPKLAVSNARLCTIALDIIHPDWS